MSGKIILLQWERRTIPIAIEPRFADRHTLRVLGQFQNDLPVARLRFRNMIGLNANGTAEEGIAFGKFDISPARCGIGADGDDQLQSRRRRSGDHIGQVACELRIIEMRVCVDQGIGKTLAFNLALAATWRFSSSRQ